MEHVAWAVFTAHGTTQQDTAGFNGPGFEQPGHWLLLDVCPSPSRVLTASHSQDMAEPTSGPHQLMFVVGGTGMSQGSGDKHACISPGIIAPTA